MRRPVLALSVAAGLLTAGAAYAVPPVVPSTPVTAPFVSTNVTHVGTIPLEGVGVSMETRTVKLADGTEQVRAFVSGAGGLSIYDATDPTAPELLGHLPIYNWENEDIAVSKDGKTTFLSEFEGTPLPARRRREQPDPADITGTIVARRRAHRRLRERRRATTSTAPRARSSTSATRTKPKARRRRLGHAGRRADRRHHNVHQDGPAPGSPTPRPLVVFRRPSTRRPARLTRPRSSITSARSRRTPPTSTTTSGRTPTSTSPARPGGADGDRPRPRAAPRRAAARQRRDQLQPAVRRRLRRLLDLVDGRLRQEARPVA